MISMQTPPQPEAATAPAPALAPAPPVSITTVGPDGTTQTLTIPQTRAEVRELLVQRDELSEQLSSVAARRRSLSEEIRIAPEGASRTGLEGRLRLLDQRILQLETDLAATGRQLSAAPAELVASTERREPQGGGDDFEEGFFAGGFTVLVPLALFVAYRRFRRRRSPPHRRAELPTESSQRLERLEQGMEAIAIEIERVAEGQRFVTKLLSESPAPLGVSHRIAEPAPVERQERAKG